MKSKEILYGSLAIAIVFSIILLSGCVQTPTSHKVQIGSGNNTVSGTVSSSNSYTTAPDLPIGDKYAQETDKIVRPILTKVFGGAKVSAVLAHENMHSVVYLLPRKVTSNDYTALVNELQNLDGWNITMKASTPESFGMSMTNGTYTLLFGLNVGENKASVNTIVNG